MKLKTVIIIFAVFWAVLVIALGAIRLKADDVYNFYFQKAPGPVTVNQGGPAQSTTPPQNQVTGQAPTQPQGAAIPPAVAQSTPTPEGQVASKVEAAKPPTENEFRHWELSFGRSTFTNTPAEFQDTNTFGGPNQSVVGGQWTLGLQYSFSRYFGIAGQVMQLQDRPLKFEEQTNFDFAAGIVITPFHIDLFGLSSLDIGFIGGYVSVPLGYSYSYDGYTYTNNGFVQHNGTYYAGAQAKVSVGKGFSVLGMMKVLPVVKTTQLTGAVAFNL